MGLQITTECLVLLNHDIGEETVSTIEDIEGNAPARAVLRIYKD